MSSISAEGALLARVVADGKATRAFLRVHGTTLGETAANLASTLRRSRPLEGVPAGELARIASEVSRRIRAVTGHPDDRELSRLERELMRLSERASALEERA